MAASEVAVWLAIVRLHDLLSKSKEIITYQKLTDQISVCISNLQRFLNTRKPAEVNDDQNRETPGGEERLLQSLAREAEQIAEEFLVKLFRHQMSKSQKGRFTEVFDLVWFFSVMNRGSAKKKMAKDFIIKISKLAFSQPPGKGVPDNERALSSSSSKRNREKTRQKVESDIVGRDKFVEDLLAWLTNGDNSNLRVISVVGEQACGKTALVRSVFNRLKIKHHFDCRVWVRVTDLGADSEQMKNLLVDILKQTPLRDQAKDLEHKQEEQLLEMLHKLLMDVRYLIVMDDLREASLMNNLLVPFVDSSNGSRVIVTTTNEEMQKFADPWTPDLQLCPALTGSECEKLLLDSIKGGDNSIDDLDSKMTILKNRILSKCTGPPPAISLLGGLLSAAESNWEALINRASDHPTLESVVLLSFDELPYMMKACALYMAFFPKEYEVPTRRLFQLWAAEGLLAEAAAEGLLAEAAADGSDGSVQKRSAEDCFHELESRNFIRVVRRKPDGSARSCRMPAFLHEFFRRKAEESGLLKIQYSSDFVSEEESRGTDPDAEESAPSYHMPAFLHEFICPEAKGSRLPEIQRSCDSVSNRESRGMDPVAEQSAQSQQKQAQNTATGHYGYKVRCLQSIASFNTRKLGTQSTKMEDLLKLQNLPRRPNLLRVLDLEGVYKPVLPEDFGNTLLNLRYLGLRWTVLESIPESVGNLLLLETLDLKHTNITKVTSAIWNAKNLRHLYLSEASFDKSIPRHILSGESQNTKLETLWGLSIETDKSPMISVLKNLRSLKKLGVTCRPGAVKAVTECVKSLDVLESLRLRSRDLFGQPASLDLSIMTEPNFPWPKNLSKLYLLGSLRSTRTRGLSVLPGNLKVLTLSMAELEYNLIPDLGRLNDLIVLRLLARSYTGKTLWCGAADFPELRVLKLWMLEELEEMVVEEGAMPKLEELEIRQCKNLRKIHGLFHINSLKSVSLTRVDEDLANSVAVPELTLVKTKQLVSKKKSDGKK